MKTVEVVDAKQTRFDDEAAWQLLKTAKRVSVARGKKVQEFSDPTKERQAILQQAMGPSGNLRAPTFRSGDRVVIGFNEALYEDWVK